MNIRPAGAELFHDEGQTDSQDEANSLFRNSANAPQYLNYRKQNLVKVLMKIST